MALSKLQRNELIAMLGGLLLLASLFLTWYATKGLGTIDGEPPAPGNQGDFSGWDIHTTMRWLLLAAALAPFILSYIIVRGHALSWPRGEMTAVIAIAAFGLLFYNGLVGKPGTSNSLTELKIGWFMAVIGTLLMLGGSAIRASATERKRKPPGTI